MAYFSPREMALLALCRPELGPMVLQAMQGFEDETGRQTYVAEGFRTRAQQERDYADSLNVDGSQKYRVAKPGTSRHELGSAADVKIVGVGDNPSHPLYQVLGKHVRRAGLRWGGDFSGSLPDPYHMEINEPFSVAQAKWTELRGRHLQSASALATVIVLALILWRLRK